MTQSHLFVKYNTHLKMEIEYVFSELMKLITNLVITL